MKQTTRTMPISKAKQHELDLGRVRYFVATNTPFLAFTNKNFKDYVQKIRPGTLLPDRGCTWGTFSRLTVTYSAMITKMSPEVWWKSGLMLGFSERLVIIASSIVTTVTLSAGLEHYFSTLGLTYEKLRVKE